MRVMTVAAVALMIAGPSLGSSNAGADEEDGCAHFTWDIAHELGVMKQAPQLLTAAVKPDDSSVQLQPERLYELRLAPQRAVTYAVAPGKAAPDDSAQGGLVHFRVPTAGVYRVSLTTRHWIDVVAGGRVIKSKDFQGAPGCERPHKIVEFELPARIDLTLQFSGGSAAAVLVAITAVAAPASR